MEEYIKTVIRYEIDGTCQKLFFYLPPNPEEKRMNILSNISPNLRLWWSFDGEKFMPPKPEKEQLQKIAEKIKEEIYSSARLLEIELKKENKKEEKLKEGIKREKRRLPWLEMQKNAILPDEERRYFSDLNRNVQDNDELNVLDNETKQKQHLEEKEILCYKIFAGILLILGIIEGLHIYWKMRKCMKEIDIEREKKTERLNVQSK
uniref:Uncharacterized protein n=1 Tax=Meloidogyne javanica TaxID=6303 RepID=A0A915M1D5_MELJA